MADALRSGAAVRRSQVDTGDPGADAARLSALGDLEGLPPLAKPGPAAPLVKGARALLRLFLRPWLATQTIFNREIGRLLDAMLTAVRDLLRRMTRFEEGIRDLEGRIQMLERAREEAAVSDPAASIVDVRARDIEEMFVHSRLPRPPGRVLVSGPGIRAMSEELASFGFEVSAVDVVGGTLPFEDGSFDAVVSLARPDTGDTSGARTLGGEAARVLRPGGRFIASVASSAEPEATAVPPPLQITDLMFASREGQTWMVRSAERTPDGASMTLVAAERR